ncbi:hypothetical protein KSF73_05655 [Burkholderiaceae bacterium DAT-1]|nr:hypothetical protein [Burkholderiaceae bacterium DAT-1]
MKQYVAMMAAAALSASALAGDWVLVTGAKSPLGKLSEDQASNVYLGKIPELPGVGAVTLYDLSDGNNLRDDFYKGLTNKSAAQMKAYWSKMVFTGKGTPPKELPASSDVKKAVSGSPNALGYIEKSAVDSSVKVVYP